MTSPDSFQMVYSDAANFLDTLCVLTQHATYHGGGLFDLKRVTKEEWPQGKTSFGQDSW